jgi:hypothetical protein
MGPTEINGLPAHALLVHVVVVMVPLAALALAVSAVWPAARDRLGGITPLLAAVALISVPMTTSAGEWLEHRTTMTPLASAHAELGDTLLPWVVGLAVLSLLVWGVGRWKKQSAIPAIENDLPPARAPKARRAVTVVLAVLALAVSAGSVNQLYRIGDSGARAVWTGTVTQ